MLLYFCVDGVWRQASHSNRSCFRLIFGELCRPGLLHGFFFFFFLFFAGFVQDSVVGTLGLVGFFVSLESLFCSNWCFLG